ARRGRVGRRGRRPRRAGPGDRAGRPRTPVGPGRGHAGATRFTRTHRGEGPSDQDRRKLKRTSSVLIDTHTHLLPAGYPADAPECFPRMTPIDGDTARTLEFGATRFRARDVFFDAERRVESQAATGVDAEVITPMPPLLRFDLPAADG